MLKLSKTITCAAAFLGATMLSTTPVYAQATRTWVSGVGDDVNPCSRTAPCKTFAGAISKTAAGGEINCLDPGGFGAVTITKSLTIDCHFTEGGALAGGNGIVVNALSTDTVVLRGLDIFGVSPPSNGVRILVAAAVHIEDCVIRRFNAANSAGVSMAPSGATELYIRDTTITENGNGSTGGGIVVQPTGTGTAKVVLTRTVVRHNANAGLRLDSSTTGAAGISATVDHSDFSGNGNGISTNAGGLNTLGVFNSTISNNSGLGIVANGANSSVYVAQSIITGNAGGVSATSSALIGTFGDNYMEANPNFSVPNNGSFAAPAFNRK
jgi:hypothetical protein